MFNRSNSLILVLEFLINTNTISYSFIDYFLVNKIYRLLDISSIKLLRIKTLIRYNNKRY